MSAELSRKYAWFGKTDHGRSLSIARFNSVCDDIIDAESEGALKQSTKEALKAGKAEVHRVDQERPED